jgi:SAM-dependent methyltransferase
VIRDLRALAEARGLADWMFSRFEPALGPAVAEVGAGIGTFSDRLLERGVERLVLIEPEPACAGLLAQRYEGDRRVEVDGDPLPGSGALRTAAGSFDLVLCQNVLEHIDDDAAAVKEMAAALRPGGTLALLVPAHPRLYGRLDLAYGHRRRYTPERIESLFAGAGLLPMRIDSFNLLGIPGWWLSNRMGRTKIDPRALRAYEAMLGLWRPIEDRRAPRWGLSLIALAQRRR